MIERPLDLLNASKGQRVLINCKDNKVFSGVLVAFDIHINIVLKESVLTNEEGTELKTSYGDMFIRGDTVNFITPGKK